MSTAVSAARANREFSHLLRKVREGESYVVTSHGRPVARIVDRRERQRAGRGPRDALQAPPGRTRRAHRPLDARRAARPVILVATDTNVLAYAEGTNGAAMKKEALELLERLPRELSLIPVQALAELFNVLVRKARRSAL